MKPIFSILGGGISGMSAAWYLRKRYPEAKIQLFEKSDRLGGVIGTQRAERWLFEEGPRTFQESRSHCLLELIEELGLKNQLLASSKEAQERYIFSSGKLLSFKTFLPDLLYALCKEPFRAKSDEEDESIASFARRRLGEKITKLLVDPMILGIYAGDIEKLSMRSSLPFFFSLEKKGKSLLSFLFSQKKKSHLFTLRQGIYSLIETIEKKADIEIHYNATVERLDAFGVVVNGKFYHSDQTFSALPAHVIGKLSDLSCNFFSNGLHVVHQIYEDETPSILEKPGFGYLVPSVEKQEILGMVFDSSIFPEQGEKSFLRLTGMIREGAKEPNIIMQKAVIDHLGIRKKPLQSFHRHYESAIPQFQVGYHREIFAFEEKMKQKFPHLFLLGNYFEGGPSVEACVARSKKMTSI